MAACLLHESLITEFNSYSKIRQKTEFWLKLNQWIEAISFKHIKSQFNYKAPERNGALLMR